MNDSNVGLRFVAHRASCRCDECEVDRLRDKVKQQAAEIYELREQLARMGREE